MLNDSWAGQNPTKGCRAAWRKNVTYQQNMWREVSVQFRNLSRLQYALWGPQRTLPYSGVLVCNTALKSLLPWSLQVSLYSAVLRYVDCWAADHTSSDSDERQVRLDRNYDEGTAVWVSQQHLQFRIVCLFVKFCCWNSRWTTYII
jgi:hypothetical protein